MAREHRDAIFIVPDIFGGHPHISRHTVVGVASSRTYATIPGQQTMDAVLTGIAVGVAYPGDIFTLC